MAGAYSRSDDNVNEANAYTSKIVGASVKVAQITGRISAVGLIVADLSAFFGSIVLATIFTMVLDIFILSRGGNTVDLDQIHYVWIASTAAFGVLVLYLYARGHYRERIPFWSELGHLCAASIFALLVMGFLQFSIRGTLSRPVLVGCWLIFPFMSVASRQVVRRVLDWAGVWRIPVIVVADRKGTLTVRGFLAQGQPPSFRAVHIIDVKEDVAHLHSLDWRLMLESYGAQRLLIALSADAVYGSKLIELVVRGRVPFALIPEIDELPVFGRQEISSFGQDVMLISYRNTLLDPTMRFLKILFDLCLTSVALVVLAPLMALLALLVACDGGPILFAHERIGEGGRRFQCLKFRTMVMDSDRVLSEILTMNPAAAAEWDATRKLTDDPRVTRVGAFLRKTSLDELPQLFNIIRLEMSLVGPRPIVEQEVPRYGEDITYYYEMRPGLTGLWQVSGRSDTSYEQRVRYDKWYVKNWTAWNDLAIVAMTFPAVLKRKGAR